MFDLDDEFVIGSQRIPWLIWIQLLVMLLLLILLYHLIVFSLGVDLSPPPSTASSDSTAPFDCTTPSLGLRPSPAAVAASSSTRFHNTKVRESHSVKNETGTSTSRRRGRKEDVHEKEGDSSTKDITSAVSGFERSYHPCHYLGLAKQAFLKCLGLDFTSKDSTNTRQRKEQ